MGNEFCEAKFQSTKGAGLTQILQLCNLDTTRARASTLAGHIPQGDSLFLVYIYFLFFLFISSYEIEI
jgi:hypothetical protein